MDRKKFLKIAAGLAATGLLAGLYAWQIEPFWVEFTDIKMPIKNLPAHLVGKKLVQISDVHIGNRFDYQYIIDTFKQVQALNPDFVVYTGDFVSYEDETQFAQLAEVFAHAATGKLATVGILGNHDYGRAWRQPEVADKIVEILSAKLRILRNEIQNFDGLNIIGLDDLWGTNFQPQIATARINPQAANLLLCHNPDVADMDVWNGYQGWILSGHTHGGQCKPPFLNPPMLPVKNKKYSAGHIDLQDGRHLYINRALGHLWQVRFNVRPEVSVFTLAQG